LNLDAILYNNIDLMSQLDPWQIPNANMWVIFSQLTVYCGCYHTWFKKRTTVV